MRASVAWIFCSKRLISWRLAATSACTNGKGTYGGGRFLEAKVEGGSRKTATTALVDFNLAYNPPCVFTLFATCPLPPAESKPGCRSKPAKKIWGRH